VCAATWQNPLKNGVHAIAEVLLTSISQCNI